MSFTPRVDHNLSLHNEALVIPVVEGRVLCTDALEAFPPSYSQLSDVAIERALFVGNWYDTACFVIELTPPEAAKLQLPELSLRQLLGDIDHELFELYGYALQVWHWGRDHQYCGRCGQATGFVVNERAKECVPCAIRFYPRLSPCVIGLVYRGREVLLARHQRYKTEIYTTLAGFMEPGEDAETAFAREVKEETNINIKYPKYIKSQAWPFPGQLMIGFWAEYQSGDIVIDENEIADAQWFSLDDLPLLPPPHTIARALIELFRHEVAEK